MPSDEMRIGKEFRAVEVPVIRQRQRPGPVRTSGKRTEVIQDLEAAVSCQPLHDPIVVKAHLVP